MKRFLPTTDWEKKILALIMTLIVILMLIGAYMLVTRSNQIFHQLSPPTIRIGKELSA